MEARTAIRGSGISRSFVAVLAVVATMGLGVTAGVMTKNLSAPAAVPAHIVQGQGGALQMAGHRGGVQAIDEKLAPAYQQVDTRGVKAGPAAVGPDYRPTTTHPALSGNLQADTRGIIPAEAFAPTAAQWATSIANQFDTSGFLAGADSAPTTQLAPSSFLGPDAQERNSRLAASVRASKPHGYT